MSVIPIFNGASEGRVRCRLCGWITQCYHLQPYILDKFKKKWKLNFLTEDDWVCHYCYDFFDGDMYAWDVY